MTHRPGTILALVGLSLFAGCSDDDSGRGTELRSSLGYDENSSELLVILSRDLRKGEVLRTRVRSLAEGDSLDCASEQSAIPEFSHKHQIEHAYRGPQVAPEVFADPTSPETLLGETQEAYQVRLANTYFVDVCISKDGTVTHEARYDIRQALDRVGASGKFDVDDDGVRIVSNQAYAEACVAEMGDIPFWGERLGDGEAPDYKTVSCLEVGTPIPTLITDLAGNTTKATENRVPECDDPQYIYSHCEAHADSDSGVNGPRVAHARNDQGTHWVLLCRKSLEAEGRYEDMAMIGHNPATGKTCFFQNQLPGGSTPVPANDGHTIPHPADNVQSEASPQQWNDMWMGIQGGIGPSGGIQCAGCHSTDPFIHSPWIDKALDANGNPVVPKMGHDPDFVEGYNGPYTLLDGEDQGWTMPKHLVSDEAAACTKCHRIGRDQWSSSSSLSSRSASSEGGCVFCGSAPWLDRLVGENSAWEGLRTESHHDFKDVYWMPPNAPSVLNDDLWDASEFSKSLDFIRKCGANPTDAACKWSDLPTQPGDPTELPEVTEHGVELATEALTVIGAPIQVEGVDVGSRRCSECHPVSRRGLEKWAELTSAARSEVGIDLGALLDGMEQADALAIVDKMRVDGPGTVFSAEKLGVFVAGVQFGYFQQLFAKAFDPAKGPLEYGAFRQRVSMPKGSHPPLSAREFAVLTKWVLDEDLAHLDELLEEAPAPATCDEAAMRAGVATIDPAMLTHIEDMSFDGWAARNQEAGIKMFGCSGADPLSGCFAGSPEKPEWAAPDVDGVRVVELRDLGFDTSFWTRSSADGRFVGNGGRGAADSGFGATITDLQLGNDIGVRGSYDPGFFPNNAGFIMQGGGAGLCSQSVLTNATALMGGIDFTEPGCTTAEGINLYQHVAVNIDGGDYFVINSQFTSDSGSSNLDPSAGFSDTSTMKISPLVHNGDTWVQKPSVVIDSPFEGDSVLSPSGRLVASRVAKGDGTAHGYMIRRVNAVPTGDSYAIDIEHALEFLCMPGAKANFSFDERFIITHHYENGTSNLYLADLRDGSRHKITEMPAGTKALFAHFVSSGWIYFLATGEGGDHLMASDAALRVAAANP
jgi:hypothetical protein